MAKASYEAVVIFSLRNGEDKIPALVEKFKALIESNAVLGSVDEWGRRKLAYPINYENEGYYVLYTFESEPDFPAEFERIVNITDEAVRTLVVKIDRKAAEAAAAKAAKVEEAEAAAKAEEEPAEAEKADAADEEAAEESAE